MAKTYCSTGQLRNLMRTVLSAGNLAGSSDDNKGPQGRQEGIWTLGARVRYLKAAQKVRRTGASRGTRWPSACPNASVRRCNQEAEQDDEHVIYIGGVGSVPTCSPECGASERRCTSRRRSRWGSIRCPIPRPLGRAFRGSRLHRWPSERGGTEQDDVDEAAYQMQIVSVSPGL